MSSFFQSPTSLSIEKEIGPSIRVVSASVVVLEEWLLHQSRRVYNVNRLHALTGNSSDECNFIYACNERCVCSYGVPISHCTCVTCRVMLVFSFVVDKREIKQMNERSSIRKQNCIPMYLMQLPRLLPHQHRLVQILSSTKLDFATGIYASLRTIQLYKPASSELNRMTSCHRNRRKVLTSWNT